MNNWLPNNTGKLKLKRMLKLKLNCVVFLIYSYLTDLPIVIEIFTTSTTSYVYVPLNFCTVKETAFFLSFEELPCLKTKSKLTGVRKSKTVIILKDSTIQNYISGRRPKLLLYIYINCPRAR